MLVLVASASMVRMELYIHCCENLNSHESQISCYKTKVTHLGDGRYGKKCLRAGPYLFRFLGTLKIKCINVNKFILWIKNKKSCCIQ